MGNHDHHPMDNREALKNVVCMRVYNQISFMFEKAPGVVRTGGARQEVRRFLPRCWWPGQGSWRHWGGRTDAITRLNCIWDPDLNFHFELNSKLNYSNCGGKSLNVGVGMFGPWRPELEAGAFPDQSPKRCHLISFQGNMMMVNTVKKIVRWC